MRGGKKIGGRRNERGEGRVGGWWKLRGGRQGQFGRGGGSKIRMTNGRRGGGGGGK